MLVPLWTSASDLADQNTWKSGKAVSRNSTTLQWRHNGHDSVSNHQPHDCLLNRLFRRRPKKTSKLRVTGLCVGNSPGTGEFPAQMASNAENIAIGWRHHVPQKPSNYEDGIAWKRGIAFHIADPLWGISIVHSLRQSVMRCMDVFFVVSLYNHLNEKSIWKRDALKLIPS